MIHVGLSEFRRAFHGHRTSVADPCPSQYLLLFYATECGLKAAWLRRSRLRTSEDFPEHLSASGHDLMLWVKELRLPAVFTAALSCFRLKRDSSQSHRLYLSHQAWRYGAEMLAQDEQGLVHWLGAICERVEEEL